MPPRPRPRVWDSSNLASRENSSSQSEDQDVSDRVSVIQGTIGALERTLADASIPRGQGLESALQRQLAARRSELSDTRRSSVIVTSTPDVSQDLNLSSLFDPEEGLSVPHPRSRRFSDPPPYRSREASPAPGQPPRYSPAPFEVYQDPPPYPLQVRQIPIVVTPAPSSLGQENIPPQFLFPGPVPTNQGNAMSALEDEAEANPDIQRAKEEFSRKMKAAMIKLKNIFRMYQVEKFSAQILKANKEDWLKRVETYSEEIQELVVSFLDNDFITDTERTEADNLLDQFMASVSDYMLAYHTKILDIGSSPPPQGQAEASGSQSLSGSHESSSSSAGSVNQAAKTAKVNVDIEAERISMEVKLLLAELRKTQDWENADNYTVELAMPRIEDWKKRMKQLRESLLTMKKNILSFDLDDEKLVLSEAAVNSLEAEVEVCVENIEFEDETRGLYSLAKGKPGEAKYPQFAGGKEEDYIQFEKDLLAAFKKNRLAREDQVAQLREVLKGNARTLIPNHMKNIDSALNLLREMYGDAGRVVKARKDKLLALGPFPKYGSKALTHVKSQVEWLLSVENLLQDLFHLAVKSIDCNSEVFNITMLRSIKNLFPEVIHSKFSKLRGTTKEQMEMIFTKVVEMREDTQSLFQDVDNSGTTESSAPRGRQRPDGGGC